MTKFRFGQLAVVFAASLAIQACAGPDEVDVDEDVPTGEGEARSGDLDVSLALDQAAYAAHEPVLATVTVTNQGRHPVKIVSWGLPAADLEEPLFHLQRDGAVARFIGAHYKRPPAADHDWVHLRRGESLTRTVDLASFYDLRATGDYEVRIAIAGSTSNKQSAWIEGREAPPPEDTTIDVTTASLGFSGRCSAGQRSDITTAVATAASYSEDAKVYLQGPASGTPRYTEWFGAFAQGRWDTVAGNFVGIDDAFDNANIVVDCKCKKPYYAYVYPSQPYKIYVCKAFWNAPMSGTDSKAGTLIHEMSHFDVVAGTDDVVYGQSGCRNLADTNPADAIRNADSHEYFAENTPALL